MSLISPVRPGENSVIGISRALPPPAAVPLIFIVGPPEGWRIQPPTFFPLFPSPSIRPMEVVVFPSPKGVGVMAVTSIYFPSGLFFRRSIIFMKSSLHSFPIGMISSCLRPSLSRHWSRVGMFSSAISAICQSASFLGSALRYFFETSKPMSIPPLLPSFLKPFLQRPFSPSAPLVVLLHVIGHLSLPRHTTVAVLRQSFPS